MASEVYKILGQVIPITVNTPTGLYTVPSSSRAVISSITICNHLPTSGAFGISAAVGGAGADAKQYIFKNTNIKANSTFIATVGLTLGPSDVIRVEATSTGISFNAYGTEIS
jgi:hypothetical protein